MRELAILTFITLDGVMQAPSMPEEDRSGGFEHGGWAAPYWQGVMEQVRREAMNAPYDMLFGRKTYDLFAAHFPEADTDPAAEQMNSARKYVVTSRNTRLGWQNSEVVSGNLDQEIARLKNVDGPLLQVHGSWELIQLLLARDLIDEFRLWTFPVIVGSGKRLFENGSPVRNLSFVRSAPCENGAVMTIYRR